MTTRINISSVSQNREAFYSANSDAEQPRVLAETGQELVQYYQDSSIRVWYNDLPACYDTHWHSALEIIVPVENWYDATVKDEFFHLVPGDILLISPGELHSLTAPETGTRFVFLFDISLFSGLSGFASIQPILNSPIHLTRASYPNIYDDVYQLLLQIRNEYFNRNEFMNLTIFSLLLNLFVKLGTNHLNSIDFFSSTRSYKQKEYVDKFNTVMDYIDANYMEDLDLDEIAKSIGFSKYHFSRLFKQYTGYTFCSYITHRRIKIAEKLLEEPDFSITEVSMQSGFPSTSTFNRVFKQVKGCTPSEYREKNTPPRKKRAPIPHNDNQSFRR